MKNAKQIVAMKEKLLKEWNRLKLSEKSNIPDWIAVSFSVQTLQWVLGELEPLPAEELLELKKLCKRG